MSAHLEEEAATVTEQKRVRLGVIATVAGVVLFIVGILAAHFTGLSTTNAVGQEIYPDIPRCLGISLDTDFGCWMLPTGSQFAALIGSQLFLGGILLAYVIGRPLTWARATVAAMFTTLELIILFGVVPNQWLAITQGNFEWTAQKVAITLPSWLTLNNEVSISYGAIKDMVSGAYSATLLGVIAVGVYQVQERAKRKDAPKPPKVSTYGRPLIEGDR
ncbi:hypothetical protein HQ535_07065 [bacterium]|nr:hypothetical protein [bacterium]